MKKVLIAFILLGIATMYSCSTDTPAPVTITAPAVTFQFAIPSVDGVLAAIITETKNIGVITKVGSAQAIFYKNKGTATRQDAGTVKINTKAATKADDNTYFYTTSASEPNGLVYQSQVYWQVTGNTANDVPAINSNDGSGLPNVPSVPEFVNLQTDQDYLLNWVSSFGADSAILILKGPSATFRKGFNNTITSYSIPKAEIAKVGLGSGSLSVINYKLEIKTIGTKNYAFVKQCMGITNKVTIK